MCGSTTPQPRARAPRAVAATHLRHDPADREPPDPALTELVVEPGTGEPVVVRLVEDKFICPPATVQPPARAARFVECPGRAGIAQVDHLSTSDPGSGQERVDGLNQGDRLRDSLCPGDETRLHINHNDAIDRLCRHHFCRDLHTITRVGIQSSPASRSDRHPGFAGRSAGGNFTIRRDGPVRAGGTPAGCPGRLRCGG